MSEKRFVIHDSSVEEYVESLQNKNTQGKTKARFIRRTSDVSNSIKLNAVKMRQLIHMSNFCRI